MLTEAAAGMPAEVSVWCRHSMRRTTVELPDRLHSVLLNKAERRGITISGITREAIEHCLIAQVRRLGAAGAGRSGRTDITERTEEIPASAVAP